ncbi:MAG: hypothetical protein GWN61_12690, partial [candidate division Zixibacteria bacterium]|nr:hypothetical protein [candidate division KSB1 bacterium]NIV07003.1 hypothetical protein [candidate division Zixibacteria bacterium]NIS25260.1 hypothetical protein [candidate division KSB1 bacterium]NIT72164.1 hypothetical protein [candidate division KSB1 bacterium]NIU25969.1 hypothetical protein [candidate division KSB1 bacterium]
ELLNRLKDLLDADETRSPQSQSVKNLQASMGEIAGDELDLEVFSKIVSESEPARALPSERRKRIERIYHTLENRGNLYTGVIEGYEIEDEELQSILIGEHTAQDCQSALKKYESMTEEWVAFFKAVHIARLEVENQYREDKHDPFFADFNPDYVPSEEWELRPPIFLTLSSPKLNPADKSALIDILSSDMSIKILLQIDSFAQTEESASPSDIIHDWIAQLAQISVNLPDTFVLQGAAANIPVLLSGLEKGFGHDGPSLISIYTGISERDSSIAPYLKSAAAQEARIFPAIVNAPGDGDELATRFSIEFSPQY